MDNQHPADKFAKKTLEILQNKYRVVGRWRITAFRAWLIIGFLAGVVAAIGFVASRSGTFEGGQAAGSPQTFAAVVSGQKLCGLPLFFRQKIVDEVKQASVRVKNTYTDTSAKFIYGENKFNYNIDKATQYVNAGNISAAQPYFDKATDGLRQMRLWVGQAVFDVGAVNDWQIMAAALRNTCPSQLPGSNSQDQASYQDSFNKGKDLAIRTIRAEKRYFALIQSSSKQLKVRASSPSTSNDHPIASDWVRTTDLTQNTLLDYYGITNFDAHINALQNATYSYNFKSQGDALVERFFNRAYAFEFVGPDPMSTLGITIIS